MFAEVSTTQRLIRDQGAATWLAHFCAAALGKRQNDALGCRRSPRNDRLH